MVETRALNLVSCVTGTIALSAMALIPDLFGTGRALWILAFVPVYLLFALAVLTDRDRPIHTALVCVYASTHTTVLGVLATYPFLRDCFFLAVLVTPLSAALSQPPRVVRMVVAVAGASAATMTFLTEGPVVGRVLVAVVMGLLTAAPSLTVMEFRQRLDLARQQAELLATTDPLTGLANRRGLSERLPALLEQAAQRGQAVGVLTADLDHFKRINDDHGHATGDQVLRRVAGAILTAVRGTDLVARMGGEEFCVVAILEEPQDVAAVAERVRAAVERRVAEWGTTVSVGAVTLPAQRAAASASAINDAVEVIWTLVDQADSLMYEAKRAGRNRVVVPA